MINWLIGFICGIIIATIGFSGISKTLDGGVNAVKRFSITLEKK